MKLTRPPALRRALQPIGSILVVLAMTANSGPALAAPAATHLAAAPTAFAIELRDVRARLRQQLAELEARLTRSASQDEQAALVAEIERLKTEAELAVLGIQARHARAAGRVRVAAKLESAASALRAALDAGAPTARAVSLERAASAGRAKP
jgi:hypothetical protein